MDTRKIELLEFCVGSSSLGRKDGDKKQHVDTDRFLA